ncbi:GNAT family N-acetyltransferase [Ramlibacter sp. MMS24-I3-19]|uniref:GNAT family N-acetyltransferase n=1 Tax=Ramlibacter sp. MMS24-I3-19 TaxID=3416606 RepID=UPI003D05F58B
MPLQPIPCIDTPRLQLVPVHDRHLPDLLAVNGNDEVTRFVPYATWTSLDDARAWLERTQKHVEAGGSRQLVLQRRADGRAIGTLLLFKHDEASRRLELGYALGRADWGRGYMREAVDAACRHAFEVLGIRRLEAEVNPANVLSCRLLESQGFRLEGTLRQRWTAKATTYDSRIYGLLHDDPRPMH